MATRQIARVCRPRCGPMHGCSAAVHQDAGNDAELACWRRAGHKTACITARSWPLQHALRPAHICPVYRTMTRRLLCACTHMRTKRVPSRSVAAITRRSAPTLAALLATRWHVIRMKVPGDSTGPTQSAHGAAHTAPDGSLLLNTMSTVTLSNAPAHTPRRCSALVRHHYEGNQLTLPDERCDVASLGSVAAGSTRRSRGWGGLGWEARACASSVCRIAMHECDPPPHPKARHGLGCERTPSGVSGEMPCFPRRTWAGPKRVQCVAVRRAYPHVNTRCDARCSFAYVACRLWRAAVPQCMWRCLLVMIETLT